MGGGWDCEQDRSTLLPLLVNLTLLLCSQLSFSLRTSETNYLQESFVFYDAIQERAYFRDVLDAKTWVTDLLCTTRGWGWVCRLIVTSVILQTGSYDQKIAILRAFHRGLPTAGQNRNCATVGESIKVVSRRVLEKFQSAGRVRMAHRSARNQFVYWCLFFHV